MRIAYICTYICLPHVHKTNALFSFHPWPTSKHPAADVHEPHPTPTSTTHISLSPSQERDDVSSSDRRAASIWFRPRSGALDPDLNMALFQIPLSAFCPARLSPGHTHSRNLVAGIHISPRWLPRLSWRRTYTTRRH